MSGQRKRRNHSRQLLFSLMLTLLMNNNSPGTGGASAAEALVNPPFSTQRSFILDTRGGSLVSSSSEHIESTILHEPNKRSSVRTSATVARSTEGAIGEFAREPDEKVNLISDDENEELLLTRYVAETNLPTDIGQFRLRAYRICKSNRDEAIGEFVGKEPCVIYCKDKPPGRLKADGENEESVQVRIHDQCFTSEVFGSKRCDCREQLLMALQHIQKHGGALVYLQQEGRGIGIANKIAAYSLQDEGFDTVDANLHLGFPEDARQYGVVPSILEDMGIDSIQLMTNNPRKTDRLRKIGVNVRSTVPMVVSRPNKYNRKYLETKSERMNHRNFGDMLRLSDEESVDAVTQVLEVINTPKLIPKKNGSSRVAAGGAMSRPTESEPDEAQTGVNAAADGYCFGRKSVEDAIAAVARGELVVVVDDEKRENEGDFIMAGDLCTPEAVATIVRYSSGVICVGMEGDRMDELELPAMLSNNEDPKETAFSVTVDASTKHGISTGISATDRSITIRLLSNGKSTAADFHRPGHIFPLRAKPNGVLARDGHTEAAVDLSRLAGCSPAGVLCEIVSEENPLEMARLPELKRFCKRHGYVLTSIVDIAQYRRDTEQ